MSKFIGTPNDDISIDGTERLMLGREGNDFLDSQNDTFAKIFGEDGNDTLFYDGLGQAVIRGDSGNDILGGSGSTRMFGGIGWDQLRGAGAHDEMFGGAGRDDLYASAGGDLMNGGKGRDSFHFSEPGPLDEAVAYDDTIEGFKPGKDQILVEEAFRGRLAAPTRGVVDPPSLQHIADYNLAFGAKATTAYTYLIYNKHTGDVFYDRDGTGPVEQVHLATIAPGLHLTAHDFILL